MDYLVNLNHSISVVGNWIFESNYEKALVINRKSFDIICAPSVGEEQVAKFETVFCSEIYLHLTAQLNKENYVYISQITYRYMSRKE